MQLCGLHLQENYLSLIPQGASLEEVVQSTGTVSKSPNLTTSRSLGHYWMSSFLGIFPCTNGSKHVSTELLPILGQQRRVTRSLNMTSFCDGWKERNIKSSPPFLDCFKTTLRRYGSGGLAVFVTYAASTLLHGLNFQVCSHTF